MPFVLSNEPATFHEMMQTIFKDGARCVWHMYDILIYRGTTEAEHQAVVEKVLQQSVKDGLAVNLTKSEFDVHETIFRGHIVNRRQVQMDLAKLETMSKWVVPTKKKEVQALLGFANYYCRFIENYSTKARPRIDLTKDMPFICRHQQQGVCEELRTRSQ